MNGRTFLLLLVYFSSTFDGLCSQYGSLVITFFVCPCPLETLHKLILRRLEIPCTDQSHKSDTCEH